jgi:hypothetical protein
MTCTSSQSQKVDPPNLRHNANADFESQCEFELARRKLQNHSTLTDRQVV